MFADTDACVAPVLSIDEAPDHPHNRARGSFVEVGGELQAAPTPRFSATPTGPPRPQPAVGADTRAVLLAAGLDEDEVAALVADGIVAVP